MMKDAPPSKRPWLRRSWHATVRLVRGVVLLEDTPYRIAMGAACGLACAYLPLFGQMLIGMVLARMLRANVLASLPWTWITNPVTTPFIWFGCYRLGALVTGDQPRTFDDFRALVDAVLALPMRESLAKGWELMADIYLATLIGSLVLGLLSAVIGFVLLHAAVRSWHQRRLRRVAGWRAGLAAEHGAATAGGTPAAETALNPSPAATLTPPSSGTP